MIYVVVNADGSDLVVRAVNAEPLDIIRREVGEPGFDIAMHGEGFGAFVNDEGHLTGLPRNVIGTCMVASLSGSSSPLAGPVVFTGWTDHPYEPETRSLEDAQLDLLRLLHHDIRVVLGEPGELSWIGHGIGEAWPDAIRELAETTRNAPTPSIQIVPLRDLRGGQP